MPFLSQLKQRIAFNSTHKENISGIPQLNNIFTDILQWVMDEIMNIKLLWKLMERSIKMSICCNWVMCSDLLIYGQLKSIHAYWKTALSFKLISQTLSLISGNIFHYSLKIWSNIAITPKIFERILTTNNYHSSL